MDIPVRYSKKATRLRLVVRGDGKAEVVVPARAVVSQRLIEQFVERHRDWLVQHIEKRKNQPARLSLLHVGIPMQVVKRASHDLVQEYLTTLPKTFPIKMVRFRSFTSQWGSCSSSGTIALHYKLSLLPIHLARYIIVHELSHLSHMNHSRAFWATVKTLCPDHTACRKALRKYLP